MPSTLSSGRITMRPMKAHTATPSTACVPRKQHGPTSKITFIHDEDRTATSQEDITNGRDTFTVKFENDSSSGRVTSASIVGGTASETCFVKVKYNA